MRNKIFTAAALALSIACRNTAPEPPAAPLPPPMGTPHSLPVNHPSVGHAPIEAPAPSGRELHWSDPVGWRRVQPSSSMRRGQYVIPGANGADDGELAVFWFGAGQGGSVEDNLRRWHGQFVPEGDASSDPPPTVERTSHGLHVHLTERFGRFGGVMAMPGAPAPAPRENWGMLGAIVDTDQGPWFFKMTGPRATIEAARTRFDDLVASFQMP